MKDKYRYVDALYHPLPNLANIHTYGEVRSSKRADHSHISMFAIRYLQRADVCDVCLLCSSLSAISNLHESHKNNPAD